MVGKPQKYREPGKRTLKKWEWQRKAYKLSKEGCTYAQIGEKVGKSESSIARMFYEQEYKDIPNLTGE